LFLALAARHGLVLLPPRRGLLLADTPVRERGALRGVAFLDAFPSRPADDPRQHAVARGALTPRMVCTACGIVGAATSVALRVVAGAGNAIAKQTDSGRPFAILHDSSWKFSQSEPVAVTAKKRVRSARKVSQAGVGSGALVVERPISDRKPSQKARTT